MAWPTVWIPTNVHVNWYSTQLPLLSKCSPMSLWFQRDFSDDIVRIIQTAINSDGGHPENRKANSMVKSFFIRVRARRWFPCALAAVRQLNMSRTIPAEISLDVSLFQQMDRIFPWFKVKESRFWERKNVSAKWVRCIASRTQKLLWEIDQNGPSSAVLGKPLQLRYITWTACRLFWRRRNVKFIPTWFVFVKNFSCNLGQMGRLKSSPILPSDPPFHGVQRRFP